MPSRRIGPLDVLAFVCEIAMVVLLVLAGHGIAGGATGWILGAALAMFAIGFWGAWMAPRSARRLEHPLRLVVQIMLFAVVALYTAAGGLTVASVVFLVVSVATFSVLAQQERSAAT